MVQLINLHKNFKKSSEVGQQVMHHIRDIFRRKVEKNYPLLVKLLIELDQYVSDCKDGPSKIQLDDQEKQKDILKHFKDAEANVIDTCKEIAADEILLPKFAFELKKKDKDNMYTYKFLQPHVTNSLIFEMIEKNEWDTGKR